jgi:tRNA nucleotidyltransferase (CCA-adding enzyme)
VELILTHPNADFDAVAALLAARKLYPDAVPVLPDRLNRNVSEFIDLYQNGLPFVRWEDSKPKKIERVVLVDTQRTPNLRGIKRKTPIHIIDHHPARGSFPAHYTSQIEVTGATVTLLVEQIQAQGLPLNSLEATLLALGIYEDTGSFTYKPTTSRDIRAAAWLVEQQAVLDTVRRFLSPPLTEEQQSLFETLLKASESRNIQGFTMLVCVATIDRHVSEISAITHRMRDMLDSAGLFVVVQMPDSLMLVCRGTSEAIDVGEIARFFGGGGHDRAAAATIHDKTLNETVRLLWEQLHLHVKPSIRVADLMSYGVQTVEPNKPIKDIIAQMRRVGHEGYPVVENGQVVGLLTRREADRAVEHGLTGLTIRDIMSVGNVTLRENDSVSTLEQKMVESGWGQIPVVDDRGRIIGIVTRTDLIKHWARTHPTFLAPQQSVSSEQLETVLGNAATKLISTIADQAQQLGVNLYMVGGTVRDLLLGRRNLDIDFVVEDDAIHFAKRLRAEFGGEDSPHLAFRTAKWMLDQNTADKLGVKLKELPDHVDFATSRNEFYEQPADLPTVYNSSIKLDLQRRDFTINTLAIQLSPASAMWRILDFYGGLHDLNNRLIRVLHSLSFVDDPTRILRAVRFEQRLGFTIEARTAALIETALPMLRRITGKRLQNELTLLLYENEPEKGLLELQARSITEAIHPAFKIHPQVADLFRRVRSTPFAWEITPDIADLYWHVLGCTLELDALDGFCERLMFGRSLADSVIDAAVLYHDFEYLNAPNTKPSKVVKRLGNVTELALLTVWIIADDERVRESIKRYMLEWRYVKPVTDGHVLRALGLEPGPAYRYILNALRVARLDVEIQSDDEERDLLHRLIAAKGWLNDST